jgi:hypothetical protein
MEEYLSLYDFLGKPAGKELGGEVYKQSKVIGVSTQIKEISNPKYKGKILMYPKSFLEDYFSSIPDDDDFQDIMSIDDDLPF